MLLSTTWDFNKRLGNNEVPTLATHIKIEYEPEIVGNFKIFLYIKQSKNKKYIYEYK
jgi:hypothetical protein